MKWKNKGNELVKNYKGFPHECSEREGWIFGAGEDGHFLLECYERFSDIRILGYIDNSEKKQHVLIDGKAVISPSQWSEEKKGSIFLGIGEDYYEEVFDQLTEMGLKYNEDFFDGKCFLQDYLLFEKNELFVYMAQVCVTERCTLKCKKCAHGCGVVPTSQKDMDLDYAKFSADSFFNEVDKCCEFAIIGGETLLYQELHRIVDYVGLKYRERMNLLSVTTNGTIIPDERLIELSKKHDVFWRISDYSSSIPRLKDKYEKIRSILDNNGIKYKFGSISGVWLDYGFDEIDHGEEEEVLMNVFDNCPLKCHEIRGSKLYYCVMGRAIHDNLKIGNIDSDYLDLCSINGDKKRVVAEFTRGYSDKGYLNMCRYCRGKNAFKYPIPIAEQY